MAEKSDDVLGYVSSAVTPCKRFPERCEPRYIQHVAFDADGVIWNITAGIASSVRGPFKKIDDDTVEGFSGSGGHHDEPPAFKKGKAFVSTQSHWGQYGAFGGEAEEDVPPELRDTYEELKTEVDLAHELHERFAKEEKPKPSGRLVEVKWEAKSKKWYEKKGYGWLELPTAKWPKMQFDKSKDHTMMVAAEESPIPWSPSKAEKRAQKPKKASYYEWGGGKATVKLLPTFRQTLDELKSRNITVSVISLNTPGSVSDLLKAFGLADRFVEIRDSWENKGKVFYEQATKHKFAPCNAIFVDDTMHNVEEVAKQCAVALHMGVDIRKPIEILNYVKQVK